MASRNGREVVNRCLSLTRYGICAPAGLVSRRQPLFALVGTIVGHFDGVKLRRMCWRYDGKQNGFERAAQVLRRRIPSG